MTAYLLFDPKTGFQNPESSPSFELFDAHLYLTRPEVPEGMSLVEATEDLAYQWNIENDIYYSTEAIRGAYHHEVKEPEPEVVEEEPDLSGLSTFERAMLESGTDDQDTHVFRI